MTLEKLADRDSINTKVFGKGGMGFGEGREKLFFRKVFPPSPLKVSRINIERANDYFPIREAYFELTTKESEELAEYPKPEE